MAGNVWNGEPLLDDFMARLPLAQTTVDLDVERRGEPGLLACLLHDSATRVMFVERGAVAVPRQEVTAAPAALDCADDPAAPRPDAVAPQDMLELATLSVAALRCDVDRLVPYVVYLGTERASVGNAGSCAGAEIGDAAASYVALDVSRASRAGVDFGISRDAFGWVELRSFAPCASARDAGLATSAVAVAMWHDQQRCCPFCGAPVSPTLGGWAQTCTNPDDADRLLFPRIEPAIITAIVDDADRILLQNNSAWRERFFSVSAGFVEAGESLEHAVRREAHEEVGVELDTVCYRGSQPWPFPASIMLGFRAHARTTDIRVDHNEVASARWFSRDELVQAVASGEVELPGRASIARHLIEEWFGASLP